MEKVDPLTKNLGFVVRLDSKAQFCVQPTEPPLQLVLDRLFHSQLGFSR